MSQDITLGMVGQFKRAAGFYDEFIKTCPANIWAEPSGKFPVWQTVYHALACVPFFLKGENEQEGINYPYGPEILLFKDLSQPAPSKDVMAAFAKEVNAYADKYFASISDADLAKKHAGFISRIGVDSNIAGVITGLATHHMYHFGACDAALRANDLEGLF